MTHYNIESFIHESTRQLYQYRLDQQLREGEYEEVQELYEHIKRATHQAAKEALGMQNKEKMVVKR